MLSDVHKRKNENLIVFLKSVRGIEDIIILEERDSRTIHKA